MAKILLIDDDEVLRCAMQLVLTKAGHAVTVARNGAEGISRYRAAGSDLVITDIFMPEEDGLGTIMALRRENRDAAIIAMSGRISPRPNWLEMATRLGAARTLAKPFSTQQFLAVVTEVLAACAGAGEPPPPAPADDAAEARSLQAAVSRLHCAFRGAPLPSPLWGHE